MSPCFVQHLVAQRGRAKIKTKTMKNVIQTNQIRTNERRRNRENKKKTLALVHTTHNRVTRKKIKRKRSIETQVN